MCVLRMACSQGSGTWLPKDISKSATTLHSRVYHETPCNIDPPTIHTPNCVYKCVCLYMYVLVCACVCESVSITKSGGIGRVDLLDMFSCLQGQS